MNNDRGGAHAFALHEAEQDRSVAGIEPVPVSTAVCGLLLAMSLTLSFPVLFPSPVGVNVTLIVHLLFTATGGVQVVEDTAKSPVVEITT